MRTLARKLAWVLRNLHSGASPIPPLEPRTPLATIFLTPGKWWLCFIHPKCGKLGRNVETSRAKCGKLRAECGKMKSRRAFMLPIPS